MRLWLAFIALVSCASAATIAGQEYLGVRSSAQKLGMQATIASDKKNLLIKSNTQRVSLTVNQRSSRINGTGVWLNFPVAEHPPGFYISRMDYEDTLQPLLFPKKFLPEGLRLRHIVIDPGHGGKDTGTRNTKLKTNEKALTLDVAQRVKQELEALGYKVTLTRSDDHFVDLKERPQMANALHADLFVSIHFNAAADPTVNGVETYAYTPQGAPSSSREELTATDKVAKPGNVHDVANLWLAYDTQRSLVRTLRATDRSVRRARFVVLEGLSCPGILVEGGFLSSSTEGSRLTSSLYRQQIAQGIVDGIRAYHRRILGM